MFHTYTPAIYYVVGFCLLLWTGCGTSQQTLQPRSSQQDRLDRKLRRTITPWMGTPYRLGGESRQGIDCSAFVQTVYRDLFGRRLPRTTSQQVQQGTQVSSKHLTVGDLVFFKLPGGKQHVGIYLKNHEFSHASTSQGVTVSSLDKPYWQRAYWTARRILSPSQSPSQQPRHSQSTVSNTTPAARGW